MDLRLSDLIYEIGGRTVLPHLSVSVPAQSRMAVVGPSGVGKTSLLNLLAGIATPTSGILSIGGCTPHTLRQKREIDYQVQEPYLPPNKTVRQCLEFIYAIHNRPVDPRRVQQTLHLVSLHDDADKYPHELSTGMRARAALARVFCIPPRLLLLDEPFAALDEDLRDNLNQAVVDLTKAHGITLVWVTHHLIDAIRFSTHILLLQGHGNNLSPLFDVRSLPAVRDPNRVPDSVAELRDYLRGQLHAV